MRKLIRIAIIGCIIAVIWLLIVIQEFIFGDDKGDY
jgi:hypothetical protein